MELIQILKYITAVTSVSLVVAILIQVGSGGLGTVFGGSAGGETNRARRGLELFMYRATIILTVVFSLSALSIAVLSV